MKVGKISESVLKRTVIKEIKYKNKSVVKGAAVGNDATVFAHTDNQMVSSLATYSGELTLSGKRAFAAAVNSVAAKGGKCIAVLVSIMMPESVKESKLRELMVLLDEMGAALGIQVAGGHTETTGKIDASVVTVTAYGHLLFEENKSLEDGMDIVMIGNTGPEGTGVLAIERENALRERFSKSYVDKAKEFMDELIIANEAAVAVQHGGRAMHNVSKGGVFTALWELGEYLKCGMNIDLKAIPIKQETVEFCEIFDLNPYFIDGAGALLVVCEDGNKLAEVINETGKVAAVIGRTEPGHQKTIVNNGEMRYLESPKSGKPEAAYF